MASRETLARFVLDGGSIFDFASFVSQLNSALPLDVKWGGSLDALNDILRGGFGTPTDGFVLVWENHRHSKRMLDHRAMALRIQGLLETCHPSNVEALKVELYEAQRGRGLTLFDLLVDVFEAHAPGGNEAEDNVFLELD